MDWLDAMPPGVQVLVYVAGLVVTAAGATLRAERTATAKAQADVTGMYSQALKDMREQLDIVQADVRDCEQGRRADRERHGLELAGMRERHAREIGELQGQITTLTALVRQGGGA